MLPPRRLALALATLSVLAACSSGDGAPVADVTEEDGAGGDGASAIALVAEALGFDQTTFTVAAGSVEILMENKDVGTQHNIRVRGNGVDEATEIQAGPNTQVLSVTLSAGTYDFVCDVHPTTMLGTITAA